MLKASHIDFIQNNLQSKITDLILKGIPFQDVDPTFIAQQISARQRIKTKLPSWVSKKEVVFPAKINLAQSSSEATANYKASIIQDAVVADITAGFGVDAFCIAKANKKVFYVEKDPLLFEIVKHNAGIFGLKNLRFIHSTAEEFLDTHTGKLDWIYIDPSRRDQSKNKVFLFEDCTPNCLTLLPTLKNKSHFLLMKTSPLIDLTYGISTLKYVKHIHVIAIGNEVKELLWELDFSLKNKAPSIKTIQFLKSKSYTFTIATDKITKSIQYAKPMKYLYEPNAALMKVGKFEQLAEAFLLKKLHPNSHLFTSDDNVKDFPGRVFNVDKVEAYKPKILKKELKGKKINISCRNFPIVAKDLIKLLKTKDGGENYVFFTTDINQQKIVLSCTKTT